MTSKTRYLASLAVGLVATLSSCSTAPSGPNGHVSVQTLSEGFVPAGADRLFFRALGEGEPVVFVNGGSMGLHQWDAQEKAFAGRYHTVRYDHRGWSRSPAPTEPFTPSEDLLALLDGLDLERAVVIGSSFGGGVALDFTMAHPERVSALVLVAPAVSGYPWSEAFYDRQRRIAAARQEGGVDGHVRAILADPYFIPTAADDPLLAARAEELLRANYDLYSVDFSLMRPAEPPAIERLGEVTVPTLVVIPENDHPEVIGVVAALKEGIPGVEIVEIEGSGHMVHMERPDAFDSTVLGFLEARSR